MALELGRHVGTDGHGGQSDGGDQRQAEPLPLFQPQESPHQGRDGGNPRPVPQHPQCPVQGQIDLNPAVGEKIVDIEAIDKHQKSFQYGRPRHPQQSPLERDVFLTAAFFSLFLIHAFSFSLLRAPRPD